MSVKLDVRTRVKKIGLTRSHVQCSKCGTSTADDSVFLRKLRRSLTNGGEPDDSTDGWLFGIRFWPQVSYKMASAIGDAIALVKNPVGFMYTNRDTPTTVRDIMGIIVWTMHSLQRSSNNACSVCGSSRGIFGGKVI